MQDLPPIPNIWEPSAELRWVSHPISAARLVLQQRWIEIAFNMIQVQPGVGQMVKQPTGQTEWRDVPTCRWDQP